MHQNLMSSTVILLVRERIRAERGKEKNREGETENGERAIERSLKERERFSVMNSSILLTQLRVLL